MDSVLDHLFKFNGSYYAFSLFETLDYGINKFNCITVALQFML